MSNADATSSLPSQDNGTFQRWSRKFSLVTGLGVSEQERLAELQTFQRKTCDKWKKELMSYSGFATRSDKFRTPMLTTPQARRSHLCLNNLRNQVVRWPQNTSAASLVIICGPVGSALQWGLRSYARAISGARSTWKTRLYMNWCTCMINVGSRWTGIT